LLSNQTATSNIKMKTYQQFWQSLTPLYDAGEAQAIVRTVLDVKYGMTLTDIICGKVNELSSDEGRNLEEIITRLQNGEPVQYVLGKADFAGRTFHVEPGVLIPRPETAELCQWIEKDMIEKSIVSSEDSPEDSSGNSPQATDDASLILDICTGSGCIAITLGLNIPNSEVTGWDISEDALRIAQGNVEMMKAGNVRIEHQDALALPKAAETDNEKMKGNDDKEVVKPKGKAKTPSTQKWDLIVSNPPYICEKEKADMEKNVLEHEPSLALFVPDEDPLKFYRAIAEYASSALKSGRALYFEINPIYEKETREMLLKLDFKDIETKEDAFGKKRMMRAIK
jgi:release factor glutamine methyltransferase